MLKKSFAVLIFSFLALVSVAQEYLVGPGDVLYIAVWGHQDLSGPVPIAPDGTIALPTPIGVIEVRGRTVKQIEELLTAQLSRYVKNPVVTVSLREMGFLIHIIGEVRAPSFYKVPEKTTLQELITRAGGLSQYADIQHIKLTSQNEDETTSSTQQVVDFSQFLKENDVGANPVLKPNDVIFVPRLSMDEYLGKVVSVLGAVKGPGTFELEEEMALLDIIALSGGSTVDADLEKVQVVNLEPEDYSIQTVSVKRYLTENDPAGNPMVRPRTIIYVPSTYIPEELTIPVNVVGQVLRPGAYRVLAKKSRLTDVIFTAGGLAEGADMQRVKIIRRDPEAGKKSEFNIRAFLVTGDLTQNPIVHEGDMVVVPLSERAKQISVVDTAFVPYKTVDIIGEIRKPGTYQVPVDITLLDVLILAGGVTSTADLERATLLREVSIGETKFEVDLKKVLTEGRFDLLPKLESGDTLFIPQQRESKWRQVVKFTSELSTVALFILIITGRRY